MVITLSKQSIEHLIELSGDNPAVKEYLNKKYEKVELKHKNRAAAKKKKVERSNKKVNERAEELRADLIKNQTEEEKILKIFLKEKKVKYDFQKIMYCKNRYFIVDFYLPDHNIVIEVDGYYHTGKENKAKDRARTAALREKGVSHVGRIWNSEVKNEEKCKKIISGFLSSKK